MPCSAYKAMTCSGVNDSRQGGAPAFQHILGQQHLLAPFVNGALGQAVHAACFEALVTVSDGHALLPQALAFTGAQYRPRVLASATRAWAMVSTGVLRGST